jgi:hypothetical protein
MNKKIRKLVDEAGIAIGNNKAEGSRIDLLNKFAELIIRECAVVADKTVIGSDKVGVAIKDHFGIKSEISPCDTCDCMYPCGSSRYNNRVDTYWR